MVGEVVFNKDIKRLRLLHEEYSKQKRRIVALLEFDVKEIGIRVTAEHLGFSINYFHKIFKGYSISHDSLETLYMRVQELKAILGVKGKEDL